MTGIGLLIGLFTGTVVGASAVGSGSLVLPLLLLLTPLPAGAAVGTSLALATATKLAGYLTHRRLGQVNLRLAKWLGAGALPGAAAAALLLSARRDSAPSALFARQALGAMLMLLALALLVAALRRSRLQGARPRSGAAALADAIQPGKNPFITATVALIGAAVALVVTLTSLGSGSLLMLALLLWRAKTPASAPHIAPASQRTVPGGVGELVGTVLLCGLFVALAGTFAHAVLRNVDGRLLAELAAGSLPGAVIGTRLTRAIPEQWYQLGIGALHLLLGLRLMCG